MAGGDEAIKGLFAYLLLGPPVEGSAVDSIGLGAEASAEEQFQSTLVFYRRDGGVSLHRLRLVLGYCIGYPGRYSKVPGTATVPVAGYSTVPQQY